MLYPRPHPPHIRAVFCCGDYHLYLALAPDGPIILNEKKLNSREVDEGSYGSWSLDLFVLHSYVKH